LSTADRGRVIGWHEHTLPSCYSGRHFRTRWHHDRRVRQAELPVHVPFRFRATGCALLDQPTAQEQLLEAPSIEAKSARRLVLAAVMMATFMAAMESSLVATAIPTIVGELGGFHLFSWAFAAYLLTQAHS
jgi:hypothetical protein